MNYNEFEDALFVAIVEAADSSPRCQADVIATARTVLPSVSDPWIRTAVRSYDDCGFVYNVSRALSGGIILMVTGAGRRHAAALV